MKSRKWVKQTRQFSFISFLAFASPPSALEIAVGSHDQGLNNTQFFTLAPASSTVEKLGNLYKGEALDLDPISGKLYVAAADDTGNPGYLYQVDENHGWLSSLTSGFREVDCDLTWLEELIEQFQNEPITSPPRSIYQYKYQNQLVYYVPPICCDFPSTLYSTCGVELCAPDGGFTGWGDGRCPDFFSTRRNGRLIFRDNRKQLEIKVTNPGTVTNTPAGIDCSDDCIEEYPFGTQLTLTAVPEEGFAFQKWSGNCRGTDATTTITMTANKHCTAIFKCSMTWLESMTWIGKLIEQFQNEPVTSPPRSIYQYKYQNQLVYYVPPICCDFFSILYSACGVELCAPDGGFTGWGDGRCPDFSDFLITHRNNGRLIFRDDRER